MNELAISARHFKLLCLKQNYNSTFLPSVFFTFLEGVYTHPASEHLKNKWFPWRLQCPYWRTLIIVFPTLPVILPPRKCNSGTKSTVNSFPFPYFLFVRMSDPMQLLPSIPLHFNSCRLYASSWMVYKFTSNSMGYLCVHPH